MFTYVLILLHCIALSDSIRINYIYSTYYLHASCMYFKGTKGLPIDVHCIYNKCYDYNIAYAHSVYDWYIIIYYYYINYNWQLQQPSQGDKCTLCSCYNLLILLIITNQQMQLLSLHQSKLHFHLETGKCTESSQ